MSTRTLHSNFFSRLKPWQIVLSSVLILLILLPLVSLPKVQAVGMTASYDDNGLRYTAYPQERYALDYGSSGFADWSAGVNAICNALFWVCNCLGNFTGGVVKEAYSMDFVEDFGTQIGTMIQNIAGIGSGGINNGLFIGFLSLLILICGIYVFYVGLIKRSTSSALSAIVNFLLVFVIGVAFLFSAPTLISQVADFSSDINTTILSTATFSFYDGEDNASYEATDLIYENIWNVTVYEPWLILEFGDTNVEQERIDNILRYDNGTDERAKAADKDINDNDNEHFKDVGGKLGTIFCVLIADLAICLFIFLFAGFLIVAQFLFLVFCCFMPFIFCFAMLPNMTGKLLKAAMYLFNLLIAKCGITLIMTVAFSLSSLLFSVSQDMAYLFIAFLQIACFFGLWKSMPKILGFVGIDVSDIMHTGNSIKGNAKRAGNKVKRFVTRQYHKHNTGSHTRNKSGGSGSGSGSSGTGVTNSSSGSSGRSRSGSNGSSRDSSGRSSLSESSSSRHSSDRNGNSGTSSRSNSNASEAATDRSDDTGSRSQNRSQAGSTQSAGGSDNQKTVDNSKHDSNSKRKIRKAKSSQKSQPDTAKKVDNGKVDVNSDKRKISPTVDEKPQKQETIRPDVLRRREAQKNKIEKKAEQPGMKASPERRSVRFSTSMPVRNSHPVSHGKRGDRR